jgi:hypothetical protein
MTTPPPVSHEILPVFMNLQSRLDLVRLEKCSKSLKERDVIHSALGITALSLERRTERYSTHIVHDVRGLSQPIDPQQVLEAFNEHYKRIAHGHHIPVAMIPEAMHAFNKTRALLSTNDDSAVIGFSLAFTRACADKIDDALRSAPKSSARLVMWRAGEPDDEFIYFRGQPFDVIKGEHVDIASSPEDRIIRESAPVARPAQRKMG